MVSTSANLNVLSKVARTAGVGLLRDFADIQLRQATLEGADRFAARAVRRAETQVLASLCEARPDYGYASVIEGSRAGRDPTRCWCVQGVVGWRNYSRGIAHWGISVSLEHKGVVTAAAIYDPYKDEMFRSQRGSGSYVNNMRLRVSRRRELRELVIAVDRSGVATTGWRGVARVVSAVRASGSAELDLLYVAAGRYDGMVSTGVNRRRFAAGAMILAEAGGMSEPLVEASAAGSAVGLVAANLNAFEGFAGLVRAQLSAIEGRNRSRNQEQA